MAKINRRKKVLKVFKRKYTKPLFYACLASLFIYLLIGNIVSQKKLSDFDKPHFVISRISKDFDRVEYMHLLLTIQEIRKNKELTEKMIYFVNGPFPAYCPKDLRKELYVMNWDSQAFLIRVKKMFEMHQVFEQISRKNEAIKYISAGMPKKSYSYEMNTQIKMLKTEINELVKSKLPNDEFEFIKEYDSIVASLLVNEL
ncbi:MAG: hypothetical protein E7005_01100 [Alphaproteobacteria bacterium]|nr:hypothetical protein [Alphaproteobacteria bacterium]